MPHSFESYDNAESSIVSAMSYTNIFMSNKGYTQIYM